MSKVKRLKQESTHRQTALTFDFRPWSQASQGQGRPSCQKSRSNGSNWRMPTDKRMDGRYQTYYRLCYVVDNEGTLTFFSSIFQLPPKYGRLVKSPVMEYQTSTIPKNVRKGAVRNTSWAIYLWVLRMDVTIHPKTHYFQQTFQPISAFLLCLRFAFSYY